MHPRPSPPRRDPWLRLTAGLLLLAYGVSLARGLLPWQPPQLFNHYHENLNALRLAKGALWAWLLYGLYLRLEGRWPQTRLRFAQGLALGLAGTVAVVLWEQLAFPGLTDFAAAYRVTGPFSQMHVGGADLDAYLILTLPFLLYLIFTAQGGAIRTAGVLLLATATYAIMVTYARIGQAAYASTLVLGLAALLLAYGRRRQALPLRAGLVAAVLMASALAVAWPVWQGAFSQQRLERAGADLEARLAHWRAVLAMRDADWATAAFGMGLGRYPQTHAWRATGPRAATYQWIREADNGYLRLGGGTPLYVEQIVPVRPGLEYRLALRLRSRQADAVLSLSLCEKWLLTSARCSFSRIPVSEPGRWQEAVLPLVSGQVGDSPWYAPRPVKISLYNSVAGTVVDVDEVSLRGPDGRELVVNGGFQAGMDRWFFSTDVHTPWRVDSLPVHLFFEQGWLGLAAFALFHVLALARAAAATWRGDAWAGALLASLLGLAILGSLTSLVDSPRLLLLILLLVGLAARQGARPRPGAFHRGMVLSPGPRGRNQGLKPRPEGSRTGQGSAPQAPGTHPCRGRASKSCSAWG